MRGRESLIEKRPFARSRCNGNFQINRLRTILCTSRKKDLEETLRLNIVENTFKKKKKKKKETKFPEYLLLLSEKQSPQSFRVVASSTTHSTRNRTRGEKEGRNDAESAWGRRGPLMHAWKPIRGSIDSFCSVSL